MDNSLELDENNYIVQIKPSLQFPNVPISSDQQTPTALKSSFSQQENIDLKKSFLFKDNLNGQLKYKLDKLNKKIMTQKRLVYYSSIHDERRVNKKVFILYFSGSAGANQKLEVSKNYLKQRMMMNSYLCDYALTQENNNGQSLISPILQNGYRVEYVIQQVPCIHSSVNTKISEVVQMANRIKRVYDLYDAFIVISGFDLACFVSTLLSFMLQNLNKCVIFTGGHFPISYCRNDFINNLIQSFTIITLARGLYDVLIVSKNKVYRANRCIKLKQSQMDTIKSPNMHSIASIDIKIKFKYHLFLPLPTQKFNLFLQISQKINLLKIHPYMSKQSIKYELKNPNIIGYVIESYTAANLPQDEQLLLIFKQAYQKDGKIFINISQNIYKQKKSMMKESLEKYHIYYGGDMTVEAALAKLSYLIGKGYSKQYIASQISVNLRGQLTETKNQNQFQIQTQGLMEAIKNIVNDYYPTSSQKMFLQILQDQIGKYISSDISPDQFKIIYKIHSQSHELQDFTKIIDRNFLLHRAVFHQNIPLIGFFLSLPIDVDITDSFGCSAFFYALKSYNKSIIQHLFKRNCHIICPIDLLMNLFIEEIKKDNVSFFQLLYHIEFKTTLGQVFNKQKRNVAHIAAALGSEKCLGIFLSKFKFQISQKDIYGNSIQDYINIHKKMAQSRLLVNSLSTVKSVS